MDNANSFRWAQEKIFQFSHDSIFLHVDKVVLGVGTISSSWPSPIILGLAKRVLLSITCMHIYASNM